MRRHTQKVQFGWALAIGALVVAGTITGCSHPAVQTRTDSVYECVKRARTADVRLEHKSLGSVPLIGWANVASFDRWVKTIDMVGQLAGEFAKGSSYREHALERLSEAAAEIGVSSVDWLDTARPLHLLIQPRDSATPSPPGFKSEMEWLLGMSLLIPTKGHDVFVANLPTKNILTNSGQHGLTIGDDTGRAYVDKLNWYTEVVTLDDRRFAIARPTALCVHDRAPEPLFVVGVAVSDLYKAHSGALTTFLTKALSELPNSASKDRAVKGMGGLVKWVSKYLAESDTIEIEGSADQHDVSLGVTMRAKPNTNSAKRLAKLFAAPANPLMRLMPGKAWYASGETYTGVLDAAELDGVFGFYRTALGLPDESVDKLADFAKKLMTMLGDHSAGALYVDGRFPLAYINAVETAEPEAFLQLLSTGLFDLLDIVAAAARTEREKRKGAPNVVDQKLEQGLSKIREKTLKGWVDELVATSAQWPVHIRYDDKTENGARCRTLQAVADRRQLGGNRRVLQLMQFTGDTLQMTVCTSKGLIVTALGPNAVAHASRLARGGEAGFERRAAYKRILTNGRPPSTALVLDPGPLLTLAKTVFPIPLEWPDGEAITFTCDGSNEMLSCRLALPMALVDLGRQLRAAFGGFGGKRK